ncbi:MAG TPA: protein-disulfide reductase DsbD domain-containing protein [Bryobacteraceae bacterium]|nr:protein-disulfide reductase DsbD domain-containing protein [Bryobacteraceae bacterium]
MLLPSLLAAQGNILSVTPPAKVMAKKNTVVTAKLDLQLRNGFHVNSNKPADDYLIPLRLTWSAGPLELQEVAYPKPRLEKYEFSEKPLSVYSGVFEVVTRFKVPASAAPGMQMISGKLRYQACSDKECFPPKTIEVRLPVDIVN